MKISKVLLGASLIACSFYATAGTSAPSLTLSNVECTQVSTDVLHISCKVADGTTGEQSELASSLMNYDVKDMDGNVIATGYGSNIHIAADKLKSEQDYTVTVYALINGNVESQTITKKAPVK